MALSKVWVHAELTPEGNVAPISLGLRVGVGGAALNVRF